MTLNVYLPEAAVQRAADDYVRDIYKAKERTKLNEPSKEGETTEQPKKSSFRMPSLEDLSRDFALVPSAYGQETAAPPKPCAMVTTGRKAGELKKEMASMLGDLDPLEADGTLGESKEGLLTIKTPSQIKPIRKAQIEKMVDKLNALRKEFYEEVVEETSKGSCKVSLDTVQKSFAHSFQELSPKGAWVEDEKGEWVQKKKNPKIK